jgi:hypothetical protein
MDTVSLKSRIKEGVIQMLGLFVFLKRLADSLKGETEFSAKALQDMQLKQVQERNASARGANKTFANPPSHIIELEAQVQSNLN